MDSKHNAAASMDDDEIIDLTDIIEKGEARTPKAEEKKQSQFNDLGNTKGSVVAEPSLDMDADIDALLAEMDPGAASPADDAPGDSDASVGAQSAEADHKINPDETLDMPGMAEVDSLLQELEMPPQPGEMPQTSTDDSSAGDDLDALLDNMLDSTAPKPAPAPSADNAIDLDGLDGLDDLDALLGNDTAPTPAQPEAAAPEAPADADNMTDLDDLDALDALLHADSPADPAPPEAASPAADLAGLDGLDDLDNLLAADPTPPAPTAPTPSGTSGTPAAPAQAKAKPQPAAAAAPTAPPAAPKAAPSPDAAASADVTLDDLDDLLGDYTPAMPAQQPAPSFTPEADLDVEDLDSLLNAREPEAAVTTEQHIPDLADMDGLDSLLDSADAAPAQEPAPDTLEMLKNFDATPLFETEAVDNVTSLQDDLKNLDALLDTEVPREALENSLADDNARSHRLPSNDLSVDMTSEGDLLANLDNLLGGGEPASLATPPPGDIPFDMSQMLDAVLDTTAVAASTVDAEPELQEEAFEAEGLAQTPPADHTGSWRAPLPEAALTPVADQPADDLADITPEDLQRAAQELLDEKVMLEASTGDVDTGAWLDSMDEALAEAPDEAMVASPAPEASTPAAPVSEHEASDTKATLAATLPAYAVAQAAAGGAVYPSADAARLSEEERIGMSELEERMMAMEEQWQLRDASHRHLAERMGTMDVHHSEHLSALEARLGSVQAENEAQLRARLQSLEERLEATTAPAVAAPAENDAATLLIARLDLLEGRLMVLEDAEERRASTAEPAHEADQSGQPGQSEAHDPNAALTQLEERILALEAQSSQAQLELEERLTILELRFQQLESDMSAKLEQVAAAAAAKIIREEIAALMTTE